MKKRVGADSENPKDSLGAKKVPMDKTVGVAQIWWALAMEDGAIKYGDKNWRNNKIRIMVYLAAILRHTWAMISGEDIDPRSGKPHSGHIMSCSAIIEDARAAGCLIDDRYEKDMTATILNALESSDYTAATLALTRTPARTLDQVRGTTFDFQAFLAQIVAHRNPPKGIPNAAKPHAVRRTGRHVGNSRALALRARDTIARAGTRKRDRKSVTKH